MGEDAVVDMADGEVWRLVSDDTAKVVEVHATWSKTGHRISWTCPRRRKAAMGKNLHVENANLLSYVQS